MPRIAVPLIIILVLIGMLYFLSTTPKQQPAKTIEVDVAQPNGSNAH